MPIQVATKPPAPKRRVHVLKLPEPPVAPGFNPLAEEEVGNATISGV